MNAIEPQNAVGEIMEQVIVKGDLAKLTPAERSKYYMQVCRSIGLNPLTRPFEYLLLNNKLTLYARRDAADQLRKLHGINIEIASHTVHDGLLTVRARATDRSGRVDEDFGVVSVGGLRGEAAANAFLKCVTKAKRRVTLSISGLGFLDESEVADIPEAEMTGHAFAHLAAPEQDLPRSAIPAAVDEGAGPSTATAGASEVAAVNTPQPTAATGAGPGPAGKPGPAPTVDDYLARWETILADATEAPALTRQWNAERPLRNRIAWPEDQTYDRLRAAVMAKVEQLKAQVPA